MLPGRQSGGTAGVPGRIMKAWRDLSSDLRKTSLGWKRSFAQGHTDRDRSSGVYIDKLGSSEKRPLGIPAVRDRVVQAAIRLVIEPIFERKFNPHSYGFRPNRGSN